MNEIRNSGLLKIENKNGKDPDCCNENVFQDLPSTKHHNCFPIKVPHDDPFYSYHNHRCMNFLRSFTGVRAGCKLGMLATTHKINTTSRTTTQNTHHNLVHFINKK